MIGAIVTQAFSKSSQDKITFNPHKSIDIPQCVAKEIAEILAQGGKITGYSYHFPKDTKIKAGTTGKRWLTKDSEQNWKVV